MTLLTWHRYLAPAQIEHLENAAKRIDRDAYVIPADSKRGVAGNLSIDDETPLRSTARELVSCAQDYFAALDARKGRNR